MDQTHRDRSAFTLIELLVVVAIIAVLIGILVPAVTKAMQVAVKTTCKAHLHQVGAAMQMYRDEKGGRFPTARYMPPPVLSNDPNPTLPELLEPHLGSDGGVYECPGDDGYVYDLTGTSYHYNTFVAGRTIEQMGRMRRLGMGTSDVAVVWDFDGGTFDLVNGQLTVPPFHALRNLLFADGHVGNYQK